MSVTTTPRRAAGKKVDARAETGFVLRPTHQQIAEQVGISRAKVTEVLHGTRGTRVSEEVRSEIKRVALELGYRPRNVTTYTVGYVLTSETLQNEATTTFIRYLESALRQRGYRLALISIVADNLASLQEKLNSKMVDGVLIDQWFENLQDYLSPDVPYVVCAEQEEVPISSDVVTIDYENTLHNAFTFLHRLGHERLCLVTSSHQLDFYRRLKASAQQALQRVGYPKLSLRFLECDEDSGVLDVALGEIMQEPQAPTALITADLWRAVPTLFALRTAGYRVPEDVSVISLIDSLMFKNLQPHLTVTNAGGLAVAERTVTRLIEKIHDPASTPQHERIVGELIQRNSTGPPGK